MTDHDPDALAVAVLQACGLDVQNVTSVKFEHVAGGMPELTVTYAVLDVPGQLTYEVEQVWTLERKEYRLG